MTIKTDVSAPAFNYLLEHREAFPGVVVEKRYLRNYPFKTLGAQLFGTLREISPDELGTEEYRGVSQGTRIGKDGIEETYDKYLRGTDGFTRVIVNSSGNRDDTPPHDAHRPDPGPAAAAHARPRAPARRAERGRPRRRGRARQRQPGRRGRVRGDRPARRRGARARVVPELRRERLRQADRPADLRRAQLRGERRAAVQPRDLRRLSDRLDVQADHRVRGARRRASSRRARRARRSRRVQVRRPRVQERGRRGVRHARAAARAAGLLGRVLLPARGGRATSAAR